MSRRKPRRESREPACITADAQSVNAVLLHLAGAVLKRKDPALFAELAEDLETRHCSARACWKKLFSTVRSHSWSGAAPWSRSFWLTVLPIRLFPTTRVADPESGPEPIGCMLSWREAYPARPVEDGELRNSIACRSFEGRGGVSGAGGLAPHACQGGSTTLVLRVAPFSAQSLRSKTETGRPELLFSDLRKAPLSRRSSRCRPA